MKRDAEVLGEMIECPERQDTEGNLRAGKHAGHGANAAVATANHDSVDLSRLGALKRCLGEQLQLGPSAEFELGHDAERIERGGELIPQTIGSLMARGARCRVQQGDQSQALGGKRFWRCHRAQPLPASSM